jgi:DNA replication protein DnaD
LNNHDKANKEISNGAMREACERSRLRFNYIQ